MVAPGLQRGRQDPLIEGKACTALAPSEELALIDSMLLAWPAPSPPPPSSDMHLCLKTAGVGQAGGQRASGEQRGGRWSAGCPHWTLVLPPGPLVLGQCYRVTQTMVLGLLLAAVLVSHGCCALDRTSPRIFKGALGSAGPACSCISQGPGPKLGRPAELELHQDPSFPPSYFPF